MPSDIYRHNTCRTFPIYIMLYLPTYRLQLQLLIDYNYNEAAGSSLQSPLLRLIIDAEHRRKARRKPMSERKHTHTHTHKQNKQPTV